MHKIGLGVSIEFQMIAIIVLCISGWPKKWKKWKGDKYKQRILSHFRHHMHTCEKVAKALRKIAVKKMVLKAVKKQFPCTMLTDVQLFKSPEHA